MINIKLEAMEKKIKELLYDTDLKTDEIESLTKELLGLYNVSKRNIAIGDYVWYNERINKVTNVRFNDHFWINKEIQLFDIEARLTTDVSTKNLRYVC